MLPVLFVVGVVASSCKAAANRGADFLDQFKFVVGVTSGGGARVNAAGLVHTGLNIGIKPDGTAWGWKYGSYKRFDAPTADVTFDADQAWLVRTMTVSRLNYAAGSYAYGIDSFFLLPALFSLVDAARPEEIHWFVPEEGVQIQGRNWIWSREARQEARAAQIHIFDLELELGLFGYTDIGYSPGETLDFLLGFLGIDLAEDDW